MSEFKKLRRDAYEVCWGEVVQGDHFVQIYEDDTVLLDSLSGYVNGGLRAGEGVVVIATPAHLESLEERLFEIHSIDVRSKGLKERYYAFDAADTLARFMVNGMPDESLFKKCVSGILEQAGATGRKVRAFGEMVVLLWNEGNIAATIRLEQLWHALCSEGDFALFCAYPKDAITQDLEPAFGHVCEAHSKVVIY
ncbi:MAG: hypothetical protein K0Q55_990 [Verrucomicrobia bacterium]|jgi:hypothetical protein|nr:hypothetical protein [Verrucomicrobiota bacterium]